MKKIFFTLIALIFICNVQSQNVRNNSKSANIKGLFNGCASFGDYDNDNDLDLIITGLDSLWAPKTILYKNTGMTYIEVSNSISDLAGSSSDWGDFDNDGDLDLLITGYNSNYNAFTEVYQNEGNDVFIYYQGFPGISSGDAKWCDFNNDGFLDVITTGSFSTSIYQNLYGTFYYTNVMNVCPVYSSSLDFGDYDKDGDMDFIVTGAQSYDPNTYEPIMPIVKIFKNNGNFNFVEVPNSITAVSSGSIKWNDYDNDGDWDILIAGKDYNKNVITKVYYNNANTFTDINAGLPGIVEGKAIWADIDNDGKSDIILTGGVGLDTLGLPTGSLAAVYKNNGLNTFSLYNFPMYSSYNSFVTAGDVDNNHKLDILIIGNDPVLLNPYTDIYENTTSNFNTPPVAPTGLVTSLNGNSVNFKWNKSTDIQTPKPGLTYNIRISTTTGGQNIVTANSNIATGFRKIVSSGNIGSDSSWTFQNMPGGTVYWSVQAIDNSYEGSAFSAYSSFILPPLPPQLNSPTDSNLFTSAKPLLVWNSSIGAATYQLQFSDTSSFSNLILNQSGLTTTNFQIVQNLIWKKKYYWRVKATNTTGTSNWSEVWNFTTDLGLNAGNDTGVCIGKLVPLHAMPIGGNPPYTYIWTPTNTLSDSTIFNPVVNTNITTNYIVKITDQIGWFNYDTIKVKIFPLPIVTAMPDAVFWPGQTGQLTASANSGTNPYTYIWNPGNNSQITPSSSTTYWVYAKDSMGCISALADTVLIDVMTITEVSTNITGLFESDLTLGDYDNDNDLDLLISGKYATNYGKTKLYKNENNNFVEVPVSFDDHFPGPSCWIDYDNDGDLDIFSNSGYNTLYPWVMYGTIYKNENGTFVNQNLQLTHLAYGDAKPIDYDNDGDLDIIGGAGALILFINENGNFTEVYQNFLGVLNCKIAVCDFDKDGDMDFAITGKVDNGLGDPYPLLQVYKNDNGAFSEISFQRTELFNANITWGDVNNDGYDDILLTGYYISGNRYTSTQIYLNLINNFQMDSSLMVDVAFGSTSFGDLDNDGDLDCIVAGAQKTQYSSPITGIKPITKLYRNQVVAFMNPNINLMGMMDCSTTFADYDNDGDLDIFISGTDSLGNASTKLYKIDHVLNNNKPNPPYNLTSFVTDNKVVLKWNRPTDTETQSKCLKYNVRIGNTTNGTEITSPSSDITTGYIRNPDYINTLQDTNYRIVQLAPGTYYWSVQAVDNGKAGSLFANSTFTISALIAPDLISPTNGSKNIKFDTVFTWSSVSGAIKYRIQISEDPSFVSVLIDTSDITTTSLANNKKLFLSTNYYWRVNAIGAVNSSGWSAIWSFVTKPQFTLINSGLSNASHNKIKCVDFDNDGDLDITYNNVINTTIGLENPIYNNANDTFIKIITDIIGVYGFYGIDWGDYDNDGNVDLLISGADANNWPYTAVYKNNGNATFTNINVNIPPTKSGSATWGDFDKDGDLDIILSGSSYNSVTLTNITINDIYQNTNGIFTKYNSIIHPILNGVSRFFDFNNDGLLDIAVIGSYYDTISHTSYPIFNIYKNNNGIYVNINDSNLIGLNYAAIDFGDYNNDGLIDIATSGVYYSSYCIHIYKNNGNNTFSLIPGNLPVLNKYEVNWGDYDNDGDLDLLASIFRYGRTKLYAYKNTNGNFNIKDINLDDNKWGSYCWADLDNDHDLDLITSGISGLATNNYATRLFINNNATANTKPNAPTNLTSSFQANDLKLNWTASSDNETPSAGITYNLVIGLSSGTQSICSPMANITNGYRKVVQSGNNGMGTSATFKGLSPGNYYWSVQAIDNSFEGSTFPNYISTTVPENIQVFGYYSIYPNPSNGIFNIYSNQDIAKNKVINVYDITGKCVYKDINTFEQTLFTLDLSALQKGFYMINITDDNSSSSVKIVIN